jgi:lysozyme
MVNDATIKLIKEFEGEVLRVYRDPVGLLTVGCGHLVKQGEPYKLGQKITAAESDQLLRKDLEIAERAVRRQITSLLNENQYGALVSFTFNLGEGNLSKSTLRKKINAGQFTSAANEFLKWDKAKKDGKLVALRGLTRRREAERKLFLS